MTTLTTTASPVKGRLYLLFIISLFCIPLVLAWVLFLGDWHSEGTVNHGELLTPARPVPVLRVQPTTGPELNRDWLRGRWTLAYPGDAGCDERCQRGLHNIRQIRLALGKDMVRTQSLFLIAGAPVAEVDDWLRREHATLTAGVADAETLGFFSQAFPGNSATGDWIYVIDPVGNLFIRYHVGADPKDLLKDLRRLLKYSKLG
jgi:cytochrome oxidase Cu insertion factor (SCO1/SenC/PrrC family)